VTVAEQLNKKMNIESMEDFMSKQEDMQADMDERTEAIMRMANKGDDEDLMDELNQLEADSAAAELEELEIGSGHIMAKNPVQAQPASF